MTDFWVCSDNIDGKENSRIDALCNALKKAGHNATNGGVGPNTIQSHGQTGSAKGQIGAFICGGVDIQVFWDFVQGIGSYYNYKRFVYVYASDTATSDKWLTCNGAKNTPTVQAHDDNYSGGQGDAIGQTVDAYCSKHKDKVDYVCGPLGCSFDDVVQNFLNKICGDGSSGDKNKGDDSSGGNARECVQKLLKHWDGDVECVIRGQTVYINRVREPEESYSCILEEGVNVFRDSLTITDVNPDTPNYLIVDWTGGQITFRDEKAIIRFGEKVKKLTAVRKVVTQVEVPVEDDSSSSDTEGEDTDSDESTESDETTETDE